MRQRVLSRVSPPQFQNDVINISSTLLGGTRLILASQIIYTIMLMLQGNEKKHDL